MFHPIELQYEWEIRANRPDPSRVVDGANRWQHCESVDPFELNPSVEPSPQPWLVVVTSYGRPARLAAVLARLKQALQDANVFEQTDLLVLQDNCGSDYSVAHAEARGFGGRVSWLLARKRFGKAGFWHMHQTALAHAKAWDPDRTLYLQDDVHFETDLITRVDALWAATSEDALRRVLYLFSSKEDEPNGRWTHFPRKPFPGAPCRLTNWFDLQAFVVDREFFRIMAHQMVPVHPNRWKRQPEISSGVGRQFTLRLRSCGHVYQAWPPLVRHGAAPSQMNPHARSARSLDNGHEYFSAVRDGANVLSY